MVTKTNVVKRLVDIDDHHRGDAGMIKSAFRVFELFEFFAERRRSASVADIVEALGYPQSSASVLLKTLTKLRYLEYNRFTRQYVPTLRVALLGSWIHDQIFSNTSLAGLVDDLHAATGATVILGMQNDIHVQYIHMAQSSKGRLDWYIKPGSLRPLCRAAVGRVLLSQKTDVDVVYLLRRINAEERDVSKQMGESELLEELDIVRARVMPIRKARSIHRLASLRCNSPARPANLTWLLALVRRLRNCARGARNLSNF